ncbi:MAG: peroxiredoxin [Verrucomicrobia bacterium]|nr:peroxiredoxin [Verrucomicrobiota bacterium]
MSTLVQKPAPDFKATAVVNGAFEEISLSEYKGKKYVLLYFYPLDFTFVCPTEILAFNEKLAEFTKRNTVVLGISVDSQYTHLAWINTPRKQGGLGGLDYPLVSDLNKKIATDYGVLTADGAVALRGLFLIDRDGTVRHALVNDLPIGRSVDEAIRVLDALQHFEQHGEVCPANWRPGEKTMKPDPKASLKYFEAVHK